MTTGSPTVRLDPDPSDWYPPDLYRFDRPARYVDSAAEVTVGDIDAFTRDGYLAVRHLLDPAAVADTLAGIAAVLEHPDKADVQYEAMAAGHRDTATGDDRMDLVRKFMWLVPEDERLQALATDERILSIVRPLCGSEDVSMIQDMALPKPPGGGREKPWHQDNAYFTFEPGTPIVGVWIALDPATADNGCMHVIPAPTPTGRHRTSDGGTGSCATTTSTSPATRWCRSSPAARCSSTACCSTGRRRIAATRGVVRSSCTTSRWTPSGSAINAGWTSSAAKDSAPRAESFLPGRPGPPTGRHALRRRPLPAGR